MSDCSFNSTLGPPVQVRTEVGGVYNYIIAGAGCSGLSLAVHMIHSGKFGDKKILIVDKEEKKSNDRTWCFWEKEAGLFDSIVSRKWEKTWFHGYQFSQLLHLQPYEYKLIRGIDFYNYCLNLIRQQSNFEICFNDIKKIKSENGKSWVETNGGNFFADYIFNGILFEKPVLQKKDYYLLQHFKGWKIEAEKPVFNPGEATLMDFRVDQRHGTTFVYVMPFSETSAMVEYTLFSKELLEPQQYDDGLKEYLRHFLQTGSYEIVEKESGIIPMTNHKFPVQQGNIIFIGTAGGQTKASSGYTFRFIQKHSAAIVEQLVKTGNPFFRSSKGAKRFHFYDSTLLHILQYNKLSGKKIFTNLFQKNKPRQVLRFLDNETTFKEELIIISTLPLFPFLKAALKQV